ncbi:MAG: hypothetical protein PHX70_00615 [Clostridium sp.]|nr:hypothetical protein [Clostridium sp.]
MEIMQGIAIFLSIILGIILFVIVNSIMDITYFGCQGLFWTFGMCVIVAYFILYMLGSIAKILIPILGVVALVCFIKSKSN